MCVSSHHLLSLLSVFCLGARSTGVNKKGDRLWAIKRGKTREKKEGGKRQGQTCTLKTSERQGKGTALSQRDSCLCVIPLSVERHLCVLRVYRVSHWRGLGSDVKKLRRRPSGPNRLESTHLVGRSIFLSITTSAAAINWKEPDYTPGRSSNLGSISLSLDLHA